MLPQELQRNAFPLWEPSALRSLDGQRRPVAVVPLARVPTSRGESWIALEINASLLEGNGYLLHVNPVRYDAALLPHQTRREQTGNFDFGLYTPAHREVGLPRGHWTDTIGGMENDATRLARILVLYFSRDGHTKSMAELVAEGASSVPMTELRLKTVAQASAEDLIWCDGIAAGAPTHMGTIPWEMKQWWDVTAQPLWPKVDGKIGCAFTSSGGLAGGGELTCLALQIVMMNYGMLVFGVPDYVAPGQTLHYGAICAGKPRNEGDREACRRLGRRLGEWVQTLICHRPDYSPLKTSYPRFPPE